MNELRMYVEHLFEGKVLTAETIELKEEIYGNLVARFEDYVAAGMSREEALAKTKASITSVDDVLAGEDAEPCAEPQQASGAAPAPAMGATAAGAAGAAGAAAEAPQDARDAPRAGAASATRPGAPVPPVGMTGAQAASDVLEDAAPIKAKRPGWQKVAVIAAIVIAVCGVFMVGFNLLLGTTFNQVEDTIEDTVEKLGGTGNSSGNGSGSSKGNNAGNSSTPTFIDPEDQREYEATMALMTEIDESSATTLQAYAGRANTSEAAELAAELPLSDNLREAGVDTGSAATVYLDYTEVSGDINGEGIDRALVYNVAAMFSVYPEISSVRVTLQEASDSQWDADTYLFDRTRVEQCFATASDNAITQLNSSLFESSDAWDQVRSYIVDRHEFAEHIIDWSEAD